MLHVQIIHCTRIFTKIIWTRSANIPHTWTDLVPSHILRNRHASKGFTGSRYAIRNTKYLRTTRDNRVTHYVNVNRQLVSNAVSMDRIRSTAMTETRRRLPSDGWPFTVFPRRIPFPVDDSNAVTSARRVVSKCRGRFVDHLFVSILFFFFFELRSVW